MRTNPEYNYMAEFEESTAVLRLNKDLIEASKTLNTTQARYLVDTYYSIQEYRKAAANQVKDLKKQDEPCAVVDWLVGQTQTLENQIRRALDKWSGDRALGQWARSIVGIGPVISAGLLAHIDIKKAPTVGHIWRFAGLDPTLVWLPKTKRPWNADLKTLCYKIGESFVKTCNHEADFYGKIYAERKRAWWAANIRGEYSDPAGVSLAKLKPTGDQEGRIWNEGRMTPEAAAEWTAIPPEHKLGAVRRLAGEKGVGPSMLAPAHIHARARRYTVKLFLAHYHHVGHCLTFGCDPPKPYVIEHLGHAHHILPPNWPMQQ